MRGSDVVLMRVDGERVRVSSSLEKPTHASGVVCGVLERNPRCSKCVFWQFQCGDGGKKKWNVASEGPFWQVKRLESRDTFEL